MAITRATAALFVAGLAACDTGPREPLPPLVTRSGDARGACIPENAGAALPTGRLRLVIATGGTGGVFFPYGGGLARVLSSHLGDAEVTAEVTGGSVDNMKLIEAGEADLAFSTADSAYDAFRGASVYRNTGPVPACAIAMLYRGFVHVVALEESGIGRVEDMRGRRVSVGSAGSSTESAADRILAAAGLDPRRHISRDNLSVAESASAMKDEKIDAFFWVGGLPTAAVTDLATTPGRRLRFLPAAHYVETMRAASGPVYEPTTLPRGAYPGLAEDVPSVGVDNLLVVSARAPEALVERLLLTIFDHLDEVRKIHPEARVLRLEAATVGAPIPFHPGAIRFYRARGVWKP